MEFCVMDSSIIKALLLLAIFLQEYQGKKKKR